MVNYVVLPPAAGGTITIQGRVYTAAAGVPVLMPDGDALIAGASGWTLTRQEAGGATSARPVNPLRNHQFVDTTVGAKIVFDGLLWRNQATGAAV